MRWAAGLLLLLNVLVWAWWQGHLSPLAEPPGAGEREPYRSARQLRPESVRVAGSRPGSAAAPASSPASAGLTEPTGVGGVAAGASSALPGSAAR